MKTYTHNTLSDARANILEFQDVILRTISDIAVDTPEHYANTIFEINSKDDKFDKQFDFLKSTPLKYVRFADTSHHVEFKIINTKTNDAILVSNRDPSRGELRGHVLKQVLTDAKAKHPDQTAYDAIQAAVRSIRSSNVSYLRPVAHSPTSVKGGWGMDDRHYTAMMEALIRICNAAVHKGKDPHAKDFWSKVDLGKVFDYTALVPYLNDLKEKAEHLDKRGHSEAARLAMNLHANLKGEFKRLNETKTNPADVEQRCKLLIENASQTELKNHRGVFGKLWNAILRILNYITNGAIKVKPTDSIEKMNRLYNACGTFFQSYDNEPKKPVVVSTIAPRTA